MVVGELDDNIGSFHHFLLLLFGQWIPWSWNRNPDRYSLLRGEVIKSLSFPFTILNIIFMAFLFNIVNPPLLNIDQSSTILSIIINNTLEFRQFFRINFLDELRYGCDLFGYL